MRRMRTAVAVAFLAAFTLAFGGCAVRGNLRITPVTTVELNIAHQLEQAESDYRWFFTSVGRAQELGVLTQAQVDGYIELGNRVKTSLETANRSWKRYHLYKEAILREQVLGLLKQISEDLLGLYARRAADLQGGVQ